MTDMPIDATTNLLTDWVLRSAGFRRSFSRDRPLPRGLQGRVRRFRYSRAQEAQLLHPLGVGLIREDPRLLCRGEERRYQSDATVHRGARGKQHPAWYLDLEREAVCRGEEGH